MPTDTSSQLSSALLQVEAMLEELASSDVSLLSDASEHPTLQARLVRTFGEQATASGQPLLAAHVTEAVALLETTEHAGLKEALIKLLGAAATAGSAEARAALVAHYHRERYVELLALIGTYVDATELMRPAGQSND